MAMLHHVVDTLITPHMAHDGALSWSYHIIVKTRSQVMRMKVLDTYIFLIALWVDTYISFIVIPTIN